MVPLPPHGSRALKQLGLQSQQVGVLFSEASYSLCVERKKATPLSELHTMGKRMRASEGIFVLWLYPG